MIPNMYKIAGEFLPCVFHVSARTLASHAPVSYTHLAGAVCAEFLFGILQQESSLTYASCAFDTDKTVIPVYFVH